MTPEQWQRVEELYHAALNREPEERRTFLAAQCDGDEGLLREVESLLAQPTSSFNALPAMARRVGAYELRGLLGVGGMGEVYRAYDTRLGRDVAIKILHPEFTRAGDRVARFEREARILASLNHPNIAAIYGIEDGDVAAIRALVLELVEGETLADYLERSGPLSLETALAISRQIIDALDAAHEKGIVHRDFKPTNIKITPTGTVKVLDFGLAKLTLRGTGDDGDRPPASANDTREGIVVGTAAYMSPEQARGRAVDKRTDVWAFGCVLFEMLAGTPAFPGETVPDIVAKVLERDPDWKMLPPTTPEPVRRVLRWCLAKDPQQRLRDLADARLELDASQVRPFHATATVPRRRRIVAVAALALLIVGAGIGALGARWLQSSATRTTRSPARFSISVGTMEVLPRNVAISPDGRYIAYLAGPPGNEKTYFRAIDERQARLIAQLPMQAPPPFFSPDSQWIAFFDAGKLKKMSVSGGAASTLADAPTPRGGAWSTDGTIVFAPISRGGLRTVSANGGPPQTLTRPDERRGETSHREPSLLPQSRIVLFVADSNNGRSLQAVSLDTKRVNVLSTGDAHWPRYVPTGHLAQLVDGKLVVVPFDPTTLQSNGSPVTLFEEVDSFSFADDGTLVFGEAPKYDIREATLVWTSRNGSVTPLPLRPAVYEHPRLSADGRTIVMFWEDAGDRNLWLYDTARDLLSKFTLTSPSAWPFWSANGRTIFYASNRPGTQYDIMAKPVDNSSSEQALLTRPLTQIPRAASPAGDVLIFEETYPDRPNTLWQMPLTKSGEPRPLFGPGHGEMMPTYSPDGRWIAYVSPETGRNQIYVRSRTGSGRVWQISDSGGVEPAWALNGRELFYRADDKMMRVDVTPSSPIAFGKPEVLFEGSYMFGNTEGREFDVARDGRFLMLKPQRPPSATPLNVIVNWFEDVRRRLSTAP